MPGDVAVIGCDDSAAARRTQLTSIALGDPRHWQTFVARLQAMIDGSDDRSPIIERPKVVAGATT